MLRLPTQALWLTLQKRCTKKQNAGVGPYPGMLCCVTLGSVVSFAGPGAK